MKYKLKTYNQFFEAADIVMFKDVELDYEQESALPFSIMKNKKILFGSKGCTHGTIPYKDYDINFRDCENGRLWLNEKIISFWNIQTKNMSNILKKIQNEFNNKLDNFWFKMKGTKKIDFFDGNWYIDIHSLHEYGGDENYNKDIDKNDLYKKYYRYELGNFRKSSYGYIIPLLDFLKINGESIKIEEDPEEKAIHLLSWGEKQELKKKGFGKGFGSDMSKGLAWKQAKYVENVQNSDVKDIIEQIKLRFTDENDCTWEEFVDEQELGQCQSIVYSIKMWNIPGVECHFGEIKVECPTDEDYFDKIMTHHWVTYNGEPLEFSKGTLRGYVDWENEYDPYDTYEIEYLDTIETQINECHFPELFEIKKKDLKKDNLEKLINYYNDEKLANEDFDRFYNILTELNSGGYIYRIVFLPDLKKLNKEKLGEHWTHSEKNATELIYKLKDCIFVDEGYDIDDYKPYLIEAKIRPDNIDFKNSIWYFSEFPDEEEINIKNQKNLEIKSIKLL